MFYPAREEFSFDVDRIVRFPGGSVQDFVLGKRLNLYIACFLGFATKFFCQEKYNAKLVV